MAPSLYSMQTSPPARAVQMCAKAINLDLKIINVDVIGGEHMKEEYLKKNPQHTVPLLDDDGFLLADSHAIMVYLVSKYGKDDSLYPKDLKKRAIIDHRLHYDSSCLFIRGLVIAKGILFQGEKTIDPKKVEAIEESYQVVEKFLEESPYVAGDSLSLADLSFVTSIITWHVTFAPVNAAKYPKITAWIKRMQKLPYYQEVNQKGLKDVEATIKSKLAN
ncbi:unnamed protein product [Phyllotreta striolata]|uniref:Glutathione S-transferase n=1 Tax=Phyllotreta striolata TaxID=444603 RepID=A0A9N9XJK2_PHYSR|nr:unnamed protein product [Phyllotreta striolata]